MPRVKTYARVLLLTLFLRCASAPGIALTGYNKLPDVCTCTKAGKVNGKFGCLEWTVHYQVGLQCGWAFWGWATGASPMSAYDTVAATGGGTGTSFRAATRSCTAIPNPAGYQYAYDCTAVYGDGKTIIATPVVIDVNGTCASRTAIISFASDTAAMLIACPVPKAP